MQNKLIKDSDTDTDVVSRFDNLFLETGKDTLKSH